MKRMRKLALITLMVLFTLSCLLGLIACGGSAKQAIELYILPQDQTTVDKDFSLPKSIGKDNAVSVKWASDNDAITIEDNGGETYNAKVTLKAEVTPVKLTISSGSASKDFTVRVAALDVFIFIKNFNFEQKNTSVTESFELPSSTTYQGETATITWEVPEEYKDYLAIDGNTCVVTPAEDVVSVELRAKFSYGGGDPIAQNYSFSVSPEFEHRQVVSRMYSVEGYPVNFSGYVVHVYDAKNDEQYGPNATFYAVDDDFCSGYYMYQIALESEEAVANFKAGVHVVVSGDTARNYNGLWETNGKEVGTAVLDGKAPIDPREHIYDFDNDAVSGVPSALWQESRLVKLSGWKLDSKAGSKPAASGTGTIFTLKRGDTTVTVATSKYISATEEEKEAIVGLYDTVEVGKFYDVVGVLGYYSGHFQIMPLLASDVTEAAAEGSNTNGAALAAAVAAVEAKVKENFSSLVATSKTVEMPTSEQGVTVSYRIPGADKFKNVTVAITGGSIAVTPNDIEHNYDVEVTYTIGDYKAYGFFKIHNWGLNDQQIIDNVAKALNLKFIDDVDVAGENDLPVVDDLGATITWSVKEADIDWITFANGKFTVVALPAEETEVTIVATITKGTATAKTVEFPIVVAAAPDETFQAITAPAAGDYIYGLYQGNTKQWLYATGETEMSGTNGPFGSTTSNAAEAATFTLAQGTTGWTIKLKEAKVNTNVGKYFELNENHVWTYVDTPTAEWTWNEEKGVFTFAVGSSTYYVGSYNTFTTFSASTIDRLTGTSNFAAKFGNMVAMSSITDETKAQETVDGLALSKTSFNVLNEEYALPVSPNVYNATIAWALSGTTDLVTVTGNTLKVVQLPTADTEVTLQVTVTVGQTVKTKTVTITVSPAVVRPALQHQGTLEDPLSIADVKTLLDTVSGNGYYLENGVGVEFYVKGIITVKGTPDGTYGVTDYYIADTAGDTDNDIQLYKNNWKEVTSGTDLAVGGTLIVSGYLQKYNNKLEVSSWKDSSNTYHNAYLRAYTAPSTTGPEPSEHNHNYTYTYDATTGWQHKGHCDVEGCTEADITEECTPTLNTCPKCEHTFTETEILDKLFGITGSDTVTLPGTYSLTGKVIRIDTAYDTEYENVTFTIKIGDREVQCYREKSTYSSTVKAGDTVTVQGTLKYFYNGTKEFDTNCAITSLTAGELTDAEKASEAVRSVTLPTSTANDITLPTCEIDGVTFEWSSNNEAALKVEGTKLTVTQAAEDVTVEITLTAKCGTTATATKKFSVVVEAKFPDGAVTVSVNIGTHANAQEPKWENEQAHSSIAIDNVVTATAIGTGNNGKYYTSDSTWRFYSAGGGALKIEVAAGYHLYSVKITFTNGKFSDADALTSDIAKKVSGTTVTFTVASNLRVKAIEVIYVPDAAAAAVNTAPVAILPGKEF